MESPVVLLIGRLGTLAVALGIGVGLATSPWAAVALPETTESTDTSTGSESTTTQPDSTPASKSALPKREPTTKAAVTPEPNSSTEADAATSSPMSRPRNGTVQASGGANTTVTTSEGRATASSKPQTAKVRTKSSAIEAIKASSTRPAGVDAQAASARTVTPIESAPHTVTSTALVSPSTATTSPIQRPTNPIRQVTSLAARVASMVGLSAALTSNPAAPVESPLPWMVLSWVRRQFQQSVFNEAPQVGFGTLTTSQSVTGVVTGRIGAADAEHDPLTMRVTTGPTNGIVAVDPSTGEFAYTPDDDLAATGGLDTFTVTVSDHNAWAHWRAGKTATNATVLVAVLPISNTQPTDDTLDAAELVRLVANGTATVNANRDGTVRIINGNFSKNSVRTTADAAAAMNRVAGLLGAPAGFADEANLTSETLNLAADGAPSEVIYRLAPTVNGVQTLASQVVLVTDENGAVTGIFSSYHKGITAVDTTSSVDEDAVTLAAARAALIDSLAAQGNDADQIAAVLSTVAAQSERIIYDADPDLAPTLAHRITLYTTVIPMDPDETIPAISTTYYIYANGENAGDVFAAYSNVTDASTAWMTSIKTATDLKSKSRTITVEYQQSSNSYRFNDATRGISTHSASSTSSAPGNIVTRAWWSGWNRSAVSAHANTQAAYDYYQNNLGRISFDGAGSALRVSTLSNTYNNAYWDPSLKILVFGHDYEAALDVVGHEYTHGVVQYAVAAGNGLIYQGESGALNESYADILGSLIENKTGAARWQLAEDYRCGKWSGCTIRDMSNPAKYGQPTNYANRYTGSADYGGVHTNSGIFNFAAYKMMTDSRTSTISSTTWAAVFYGSLAKLPSNATFSDGRAAILSTAVGLGFTTTAQQAIKDSFNAVGVY